MNIDRHGAQAPRPGRVHRVRHGYRRSFTYHRELKLYQSAGMTAPEILKRATFDSEEA
jgi:hypothetical protein